MQVSKTCAIFYKKSLDVIDKKIRRACLESDMN